MVRRENVALGNQDSVIRNPTHLDLIFFNCHISHTGAASYCAPRSSMLSFHTSQVGSNYLPAPTLGRRNGGYGIDEGFSQVLEPIGFATKIDDVHSSDDTFTRRYTSLHRSSAPMDRFICSDKPSRPSWHSLTAW